ncbi:hypothetical protein CJU89_1364 [Yarrowia sp. B02]|nr:hypothetical protein CJU89_1364 [Yarrowia sp. B02]
MFPLEIWDVILHLSDIETLLRLSSTNSYFLRHCESFLEAATRTQIHCSEAPLRRFADFNGLDHQNRPFFYDEIHTVAQGVPLENVATGCVNLQSTGGLYPTGDRGLLDADPRSLWTSTSEPTETEGHFFQAYSDIRGYYMKVYLEVIDKNTFESKMVQVPISEDTEPPIDAVSAHNDRVFITVSRRRSFTVFYFDPDTSKFHRVLQTTGNYANFTQNKVLADLNTIRVLSHDGCFINFELHGLYTAPNYEPRTITGYVAETPRWSHFCLLSHPRSKLKSSRFVAWFSETNDFDINKHRQSLMCVVVDLQSYTMWKVPMHCLLLVVGLYHHTIGCWLLDKDPFANSTPSRKNLLDRALVRWRNDPSDHWVIK